jgi:hypothetical protein
MWEWLEEPVSAHHVGSLEIRSALIPTAVIVPLTGQVGPVPANGGSVIQASLGNSCAALQQRSFGSFA